jgi:hypothetical protein
MPLEPVPQLVGDTARPENLGAFKIEVMRRSSQQRLLARMIGGQMPPNGLI